MVRADSNRRVKVAVDFGASASPGFDYGFQRYLLQGLRAVEGVELTIEPCSSRYFAGAFERRLRGARSGWTAWNRARRVVCGEAAPVPVPYEISLADGRKLNVAIDVYDRGQLAHTGALDWCHLYLKHNHWPSRRYEARVRPLVNGNPLLRAEALRRLVALRRRPKTRDVVYWSYVWEPIDRAGYTPAMTHAIVEHQLRVFETLKRAVPQSDAIAVFPERLQAMDVRESRARLERIGVVCRTGWGDISTERLWDGLAGARVVLMGQRTHHSISWRMTDLLAMGACIFCDAAPYANWPVPLRAGEHFATDDCGLSPEFELPGDGAYDRLAQALVALLADTAAIEHHRERASVYFDAHATPEAVARYVVDTVSRHPS
jgi:hypothetical protein